MPICSSMKLLYQVMDKFSAGKPGEIKANLQQILSMLKPSYLAFALRLRSKYMA